MKDSLKIVALQHALTMAIGSEQNLSSMLKIFLRCCLNRLTLASAHIFLYHDQSNHPKRIHANILNGGIKHYLSIPVQHIKQPWNLNLDLQDLAEKTFKTDENIHTLIDNKNFYSLVIPAHGVLIFESVYELPKMILLSLNPIMQKLSSSCYASINYDSLKKEATARKLAEDIITHQAQHDELTQLSNRRKLSSDLTRALKSCKQNNTYGAIIFIDLNQFKSINDVMGHEVGDEILKLVAKRLSRIKQPNDTVARFGGDEFIILLPHIGNSENIAKHQSIEYIKRINKVISEPFIISRAQYKIGCSMGFEIFPRGIETDVDIVKHADLAMYEAKDNKHINYMQYEPLMSDKLGKKIAYLEALRESVSQREFTLYYQPQIDHNNKIIGAEALIRWNNPKYINDSPANFIPIAEDADLINELGDWIIETACVHAKQLQDIGIPTSFKRISFNISAKQLTNENFVKQILTTINDAGVPHDLIAIEITENILIQNIEKVIAIIAKLRDYGILCSIDDFGTGYSSLSYLKKIPAYAIKIDRSFVHNMHMDQDNRSISELIIALGKNLEMDIIAEGIECKEELNCLKSLGCYTYQGYLFYRPMPFNQLKALLKERSLSS